MVQQVSNRNHNHSFIHSGIYIAPLQGNYSEALPTTCPKRTVLSLVRKVSGRLPGCTRNRIFIERHSRTVALSTRASVFTGKERGFQALAELVKRNGKRSDRRD